MAFATDLHFKESINLLLTQLVMSGSKELVHYTVEYLIT
ncbi:hypothetical protein MUGA111182_16640 [Mucilaginibacter galii]